MPKLHQPSWHCTLIAFVIILCGLTNTSLQAQAPTLTIEPTYISIADGLVSPTVNAVIQDSYGIIWVGTTQGLQRYDGYNFQTFKNVPGKPSSLQHNLIWSLLEDANHDIWVSNGKGVSKYIRQKNEFKNYEFAPAFNFTSNSQIAGFKLFIDSQKNLWVNSFNLQVLQYDPTSDEWRMPKYELANAVEPDQINGPAIALAEDLNGNLWLGTLSYGLMKKAKSENLFKPIASEKTGNFNFKNSENTITAIYADSTNTLWITTRSGVYKFNPYTGDFKTLKEYTPSPGEAWNNWNSILPDPQGNIWIANNFRGMLKFEGISDRFTEIEIAGKMIMRTHGWNITMTQFMIDRSGIFWIGSRESGLLKYDPVNKPFQYLSHDENNPKSISAGGAFGILASKVKPGITYVGTRGGGVNIYDPQKADIRKDNLQGRGRYVWWFGKKYC
jgi:ligand-binding sensor domain-containing protein